MLQIAELVDGHDTNDRIRTSSLDRGMQPRFEVGCDKDNRGGRVLQHVIEMRVLRDQVDRHHDMTTVHRAQEDRRGSDAVR